MAESLRGVITLRPKNWGDFQHYKHRSPPWIRFHRSILDNYEFQCLPVASRALAPMLWLIASEGGDPKTGAFDASPSKLAFRLRMSREEVISALKPLIDAGFFYDASEPLAECLQGASEVLIQSRDRVETETEFLNQAGKSCWYEDIQEGAL